MIHVLGAILIDAIACCQSFNPGTSSVAPITVRMGGVGYNIFQALGSVPRRLVTAVGDGPFSRYAEPVLAAHSQQVLLRSMPGRDIGLYVALMEGGRLLYGATDASTFEAAMDKAFLDLALADVSPGDIVVTDANLLPDSLQHLNRRLRDRNVWLVFEPVSIDKSARARSSLHNAFLVTPTDHELAALIGTARPTTEEVMAWMRDRRIDHVVVTLGHEGLQWLHGGQSVFLSPGCKLDVADTTGAGDTLLGSLLRGLDGWRERQRSDCHATLQDAVTVPMADLLRDAMDAVEGYLSEREGLRRDP